LFIALAAVVVGLSDVSTGGKKGRVGPLVLIVVGIACGIIALTSSYWMHYQLDTPITAGPIKGTNYYTQYSGISVYGTESRNVDSAGTEQLKTTLTSTFSGDTFEVTTVTPTSSKTEKFTKCADTSKPCGKATLLEQGVFAGYEKGAEEVLGCAIPSLALALLGSVGLGLLLYGKSITCLKLITFGLLVAAASLGFLGLFLYASHTDVGYSFVLYAFAGFLWVAAVCFSFILLNPSNASEKAGLLGKK
jgi:hypothetical protein